jgi:hypothetical protein
VTGIVIVIVLDTPSETDLRGSENAKKLYPNVITEIVVGDFGSPGMARNEGLMYTKSFDWTFFWDIDDSPKIESIVRALSSGANIKKSIIGRFEVVDSNMECLPVQSKSWSSDSRNLLTVARNPGLWRWAFRSSDIENLEFQNFVFAEDQCFIFDFLTNEPPIEFNEAIFYQYKTNVFNQLTSNAENALDLVQSTRYLSNNLYKASHRVQWFGIILITRQVLSLTKRRTHLPKKALSDVWKTLFITLASSRFRRD